MKKSIKQLTKQEISDFLSSVEQPTFRVNQILEWLYIHRAYSFQEMTNLPLALRDTLDSHFYISQAHITSRLVSTDGTVKYLFSFDDGTCVETVAIPDVGEKGRLTVCASTQVGCAMGCVFCATGKEGFTRNLGMGEIVDQILDVQDDLQKRVSNLVVMGQGEPFFNFDATIDALKVLNNPKGIALGARHITVSSCGIIKGVRAFANFNEQFTLAISLHSARQDIRNSLMPHLTEQPLYDLKQALLEYQALRNRRISLEHIMIQDVNDSEKDLSALIDFCDGLQCHINLIPLNSTSHTKMKASRLATLQLWVETCEHNGIEATIRHSRGSDISGACGQLKNSL